MARSVKEGAERAGIATNVDILQVPETLSQEILDKMHAPPKADDIPIATTKKLLEYDAYIFGVPTRFGHAAAQLHAYWDATGGLWAQGQLHGKPAGIFVSTGTTNGGQEATARNFIEYFVHHGMPYVPLGYSTLFDEFNRNEVRGGSPYGAGTYAGADGSRSPTELEKSMAAQQGKDFVKTAIKFVATLPPNSKSIPLEEEEDVDPLAGKAPVEKAKEGATEKTKDGKKTITGTGETVAATTAAPTTAGARAQQTSQTPETEEKGFCSKYETGRSMLWILLFPPEVVQIIFDDIPLPYSREYIDIDQIGVYAFNSLYSNIVIVDCASEYRSSIKMPKALPGETDVFSRPFNCKKIHGSLKYPGNLPFNNRVRDWKAPAEYFLDLEEFIEFIQVNPKFSPSKITFVRPRDLLRFQSVCSDMSSKVRRIHLYTKLDIKREAYFDNEFGDCEKVMCSAIPNVRYSYILRDIDPLDVRLPHLMYYVSLIECPIGNFETTFKGLSITHLVLDLVEINADDLEFLPSTVKYLSLKRSLWSNSNVLDIKFPPHLIELDINQFGDSCTRVVDLSALNKLRYLKISPLQITAFSDLKLPKSIEMLKLGASRLESLDGIEEYKNLHSMYFQPYIDPYFNTQWYISEEDGWVDLWEDKTLFCAQHYWAGAFGLTRFPKARINKLQISGNYGSPELRTWSCLHIDSYPNLTVLDLSNTSLSSITSWIFPETLMVLSLSSCGILKFQNHNVANLKNIRRLSLHDNGLITVEDLLETLSSSLKELDLSVNMISKFQGSYLSLISLNLSLNDLPIPTHENLSVPDCCERLCLDNNWISEFEKSFHFPKNLKELSINESNLTSINNENFFNKLPQGLRYLLLGFHEQPTETSANWNFPKSLRQLCLKNASPMLALNDLPYLEELVVTDSVTMLDSLPPSLKKMELEDWTGSLARLVNLEVVSLSGWEYDKNDLDSVTKNILVPESVKYITVYDPDASSVVDFRRCKQLHYIELRECSLDKFTECMLELLESNPRIRVHLGASMSFLENSTLENLRESGGLVYDDLAAS
ncbi:uncharacterized protein J8A68_000651 [[Candida] subhashii]|uniref:Flavodoxin-like domain-containing protein n=1 Tax=[Candida] subhashii TaxID=561895 RepID=A0A8J5QJE3_9ASCO|nr:uncharacterized protein J8A68_000651 [[Candida] subhashii]KAG7665826.1 hypothetical protein J8A68_000651 [[Candida] subhashii]